jgi:cell division protein FtsB
MPKLLHSKAFIFFLGIIFILSLIALGRESYRYFRVSQEIKNLEKRIEELEANNEELAKMEEYFQSEEFLEKEARLKLGLTKPGEKLIIIKQLEEELEEEIKKEGTIAEEISNIQRWWEYFFNSRR